MSKKKICYYLIATHLGGAERSLLELLQGLKAQKELEYKPWVVLPKNSGPLIELLENENIEYTILPIPSRYLNLSRSTPIRSLVGLFFGFFPFLVYLSGLRKLLLENKPDIIHTNGMKCQIFSRIIGIKTPMVWHLRDIINSRFLLFLLKKLSKGKVFIIANSIATASSFGEKENKITVIYNGLDLKKYFHSPNRYFNGLLKIPNNRSIVGVLGAIARWKGQLQFVQMAERILKKGMEIDFVIIGDEIYDTGSERGFLDELKREVRRLGYENRIHFVGFQQDSVRAINGLDILVHASIKPEPFGRVIIEAMACGVPVVCSAAGGALETVEHGVTGFFYSPGSVEEMTQATENLLQNGHLRKKITYNALSNVKKKFSIDSHVEQILKFYSVILRG